MHTKQHKAALKASGQRSREGVSNTLLNMHVQMTCSAIMSNHTVVFLGGVVLTQLGYSPISPTNLPFILVVWRLFCVLMEDAQTVFYVQKALIFSQK